MENEICRAIVGPNYTPMSDAQAREALAEQFGLDHLYCERCGHDYGVASKVDSPVCAKCGWQPGVPVIPVPFHITVKLDPEQGTWADDGGNAYRLSRHNDPANGKPWLQTSPIDGRTDQPVPWNGEGEGWGEPCYGQIDYDAEYQCRAVHALLLSLWENKQYVYPDPAQCSHAFYPTTLEGVHQLVCEFCEIREIDTLGKLSSKPQRPQPLSERVSAMLYHRKGTVMEFDALVDEIKNLEELMNDGRAPESRSTPLAAWPTP